MPVFGSPTDRDVGDDAARAADRAPSRAPSGTTPLLVAGLRRTDVLVPPPRAVEEGRPGTPVQTCRPGDERRLSGSPQPVSTLVRCRRAPTARESCRRPRSTHADRSPGSRPWLVPSVRDLVAVVAGREVQADALRRRLGCDASNAVDGVDADVLAERRPTSSVTIVAAAGGRRCGSACRARRSRHDPARRRRGCSRPGAIA